MTCGGDEPSLAECQHRNWGAEDCDHKEDAGCICQPSLTAAGTTPTLLTTDESESEPRIRSTAPPADSDSGQLL